MPAIVVGHRGYPTIRDFWEHYTEFADLYDRFALSSVRAVEEMDRLFGLAGVDVLNIGSGSGRDSFEIARRATHVVGIEPSDVDVVHVTGAANRISGRPRRAGETAVRGLPGIP